MKRAELIQRMLNHFEELRRKMPFKEMPEICQQHLSHSQIFIMMYLSEHPDISMKEIAGNFGMTSSAATQFLDPLLVTGLVSKQEAESDRRVLKLNLTTKGKKLFLKLKDLQIQRMSSVFKGLTDAEIEILCLLIEKLSLVSIP